LGNQLGIELGVPVVGKDRIKEALAEISLGNVSSGKLGQIASETLWQLVSAVPGMVIAESWWYRPRDLGFVIDGLARSGSPDVMEVWCELPPSLAWKRYVERERHEIHPAAAAAERDWADWAASAAPLGLGRTIKVDTTSPVDASALAVTLAAMSVAFERP
jgi:hypothetical protein